jgi:hypothetical protein
MFTAHSQGLCTIKHCCCCCCVQAISHGLRVEEKSLTLLRRVLMGVTLGIMVFGLATMLVSANLVSFTITSVGPIVLEGQRMLYTDVRPIVMGSAWVPGV